MRVPLQDQKAPPQQKLQTLSIPAPAGWSTKATLAAMDPTQAVVLDNWLCRSGGLVTRKGSTSFATGLGTNKLVQTLMPYKASGTGKLFGATSDGIYDVTAGGVVGAVAVAATSGQWQYVNFANSAGTFLIAVNGQDSLVQYNGTAWSSIATLGVVNTNTLSDIAVHQQRLMYVVKNSTQIHFATAGAISGAPAGSFYAGQLFKRGGFVQAISTWTVDGGSGSNDRFVAVSSEGEVAVWQGTDPASANTWTPVGVYYVGRPLGQRCLLKYGGDLLILTERGLFPLSSALQSAVIDKSIALTDEIEPTLVSDAMTLFSTLGWQVEIHVGQQLLIINVPGTPSAQYAMHLQSKGWSRITGWVNFQSMCYWNGNLYYGEISRVIKAFDGTSDLGSAIVADCVPAFNYMGSRGQLKHVKLVRPIFSSTSPFGYTIAGNTDFEFTPPTSPVSASTVIARLWGGSGLLWGGAGLTWTGTASVDKRWQTVASFPCFAYTPWLRLSNASQEVTLTALDYGFVPGGVL